MYKQVLEHITGVEIFPIISFIIFFVFFLLMLGWVLTLSKNYIRKMENIPLDEDSNSEKSHNLNAGGLQ